MRKGSFKLMKKLNQQVILKIIYEKRAISRAKIAEISNLSPATVTNIVRELMELGLLQETSHGKSRGGRKPVLLELNPDGAYFVGFEWGITDIYGVLLDLNKNIIKTKEVPVTDYKIDSFVNITTRLTRDFQSNLNDLEKLYGIGIGIHGLVDPVEGISLFAPHFNWHNISVKEILKDKLDVPVIIDNDVRTMALAEKWNGRDNFVFINTGSGIGAAIVLDGKLHLGRDYSAGEFGHMTIVEDGPGCSCGNSGCLESLISTDRLAEKYKPLSVKDKKVNVPRLKWESMIKDAKNGNKEAIKLITDAGKFLGTGLANIVNFLNPEEIIIGGDFIDIAALILPVIRKQVKDKSLKMSGSNLNIVITPYGDKAGSIGAATMVLQELFKFEEG